MEVPVRSCYFHFHVGHTPQSHGDGRVLHADHVGIRDQDDVGFESFLVRQNEFVQVVWTNFLFAFDHEFDIAGQISGSHHGLQSFHMHVKLTLIVSRSAGKNGSVRMSWSFFDHWLERRRVPKLIRVGWLHVVMPINQNCRQCVINDFFPVYDGVACRRADFS